MNNNIRTELYNSPYYKISKEIVDLKGKIEKFFYLCDEKCKESDGLTKLPYKKELKYLLREIKEKNNLILRIFSLTIKTLENSEVISNKNEVLCYNLINLSRKRTTYKENKNLEKKLEALHLVNSMVSSNLTTLEQILKEGNRIYIEKRPVFGLDSPIFFGLDEMNFYTRELEMKKSRDFLDGFYSSIFKYLFNLFLLSSFMHKKEDKIYKIKFPNYILDKELYESLVDKFNTMMRNYYNTKEFLKNSPIYLLGLTNKEYNISQLVTTRPQLIYEELVNKNTIVEVLLWFKINVLRRVIIEKEKVPTEIEKYLQFRFYPESFFSYSISTKLYKNWFNELVEFLSYS